MCNSVANFQVNAHRVFEYSPIVSTATSIITLFQKAMIQCQVWCQSTPTTTPYYTYIAEKHALRCIALLIPFIGNFAVFLYDAFTFDRTGRTQAHLKAMKAFENEDYETATRHFQNELKILGKVNPEKFHLAAPIHYYLGLCLEEQGSPEALNHLRTSLTLQQESPKQNIVLLANTHYHIGLCLIDEGDNYIAEEHLRPCLHLRSTLPGIPSLDITNAHYHLGRALNDNDFERGPLHLKKAYEEYERADATSQETEDAYNAFSLFLEGEMLIEFLQDRVNTLQQEDVNFITLLTRHVDALKEKEAGSLRLAEAHFYLAEELKTTNSSKAIEHFQAALNIQKEKLKNHNDTAGSHKELALLFEKAGNTAKALHHRKALAPMKEELNHPLTDRLNTHTKILEHLETLKQTDNKLVHLKAVAKLNEEISATSLETGIAYWTLGEFIKEAENQKASVPAFKKALAIYKVKYKKNPWNISLCYNRLGCAYASFNTKKALSNHLSHLEITKTIKKDNPNQLAIAHNNVVLTLTKAEDKLEHLEAIARHRTTLDKTSKETAEANEQLAQCHVQINQHEDAVPFFVLALVFHEKSNTDSEKAVSIRQSLVKCALKLAIWQEKPTKDFSMLLDKTALTTAFKQIQEFYQGPKKQDDKTAQNLYKLSGQLLENHKATFQIPLLREAIRTIPEKTRSTWALHAYKELGNALMALDHHQEALPFLEKARDLLPEKQNLFSSHRRVRKALSECRKALGITIQEEKKTPPAKKTAATTKK